MDNSGTYGARGAGEPPRFWEARLDCGKVGTDNVTCIGLGTSRDDFMEA